MKILIVNASGFQNSVTEGFCFAFEKAAELKQIKMGRLNLHEDAPPTCDGTYKRPGTLSQFHRLVLEADGLFIATPCHWFNVPGVLKNFIDHLTCIESELWQKERPLCVAVYSPEGGEYGTLASILLPLNMLGFAIPANGYAYFNGGDRWAYDEISQMPERMLGYYETPELLKEEV